MATVTSMLIRSLLQDEETKMLVFLMHILQLYYMQIQNNLLLCKSHLVKSLSTSYSYFIHVSRYTKNSKKAKSAMAVKANTDTEKEKK